MLKNEIKKINYKSNLQKWLKSTWVNLFNSQHESWDHDKFIKSNKKLWNPTLNRSNVKGKSITKATYKNEPSLPELTCLTRNMSHEIMINS